MPLGQNRLEYTFGRLVANQFFTDMVDHERYCRHAESLDEIEQEARKVLGSDLGDQLQTFLDSEEHGKHVGLGKYAASKLQVKNVHRLHDAVNQVLVLLVVSYVQVCNSSEEDNFLRELSLAIDGGG